MAKIKAILFDMDGVLIDAKEWHYEALNNALNIFGYSISRYDHLVTYDGLPTKKKLQILSIEQGLPVDLHDFINEMKQIYTMEMVHTRCKPVFQHQYAMSHLRNEGYKIAVCSNSIKKTVEIMLEKADLLKYVDFTLSNQDVRNSKPDPEIYQVAMKRFALEPDQCMIVEDNENGVKAAVASGGGLMQVNTVLDVNYANIKQRINYLETHGDQHIDSISR